MVLAARIEPTSGPLACPAPIMFTLAHSALFIKQELLADRANRKPAGDGFVYEGNDCRGFSGRPDGYSDWTCPPKRTAAGSCGPFLFGCNSAQAARHLHGTKLAGAGRLWMMRCTPLISIVAHGPTAGSCGLF